MTRIINPDSAGKERTRLAKCVVLTVRELAKQAEPGEDSRDMSAFICLALNEIAQTIEASVAAWEKRGYWVKADRFRLEWAWAEKLSEKMRPALIANDWDSIIQISTQIPKYLSKITISSNHRMGTPWKGAWKSFIHK